MIDWTVVGGVIVGFIIYRMLCNVMQYVSRLLAERRAGQLGQREYEKRIEYEKRLKEEQS